MRKNTKRFASVALVASLLFAGCGGSDRASDTTMAPDTTAPAVLEGPKVVASTSWVAAMAKLAGATDITVIAPSNLQHPPDYDPKASDLAAVAEADFILLAGFEGFAARLKEAAGSTAKVETVATEYYPEALAKEVARLATVMGLDAAEAEYNASQFMEHWMAESKRIKEALAGKTPVVVGHMYVGAWAVLAGLEVKATFGPAPLTPSDIVTLSKNKPTVILENKHMPVGSGLIEATKATAIEMVNFPGDDLDLNAVVTANADALIAALK
jgi:zinc transport system substrate-binding protein